jgi:high-affinity iron transporter
MNFGAAVLMFREGLEAALIVAIMLGYLKKVGRIEHRFAVWGGALSAAAAAAAFAVLLNVLGNTFEDPAKAIYEGGTAFLAVGMLTYMVFWMSKNARYIKGSLEQSMNSSFVKGASWGLFGLAFLTVAREGVETALFLSASAFQTSAAATLVGSASGLVLSIAIAYAVYIAGARLNLRLFFKVAGVLLVVFGAALFRFGISEFQDIGWVPPIINHFWNTAQWIASESPLGTVLQALVGYTASPSLTEIIGYTGYLVVMLTLISLPPRKQVSAPAGTTVPPVAPMETKLSQEVSSPERSTASTR